MINFSEKLQINIDNVIDFVSENEIYKFKKEITDHISALHNKTGKGSDFLGWVDLPSKIKHEEIEKIEKTVKALKDKIEILVVIGIGGSYLGAKSVIDALSSNFQQLQKKSENPLILFAGQNMSEDYLFELAEILNDRSFGIAVISKSGTTTEPAIAFRILKKHLEDAVGKEEARKRIIAITDSKVGALRKMSEQQGYSTFDISDDIGGRYSVLTPVGLFPIAMAGYDIHKILEGARLMEKMTGVHSHFEDNPAAIYAATRNALYRSGKTVEILVNYRPKLHNFSEWWKQLYGESEGKEHKGIFPASVDFTSDLHSMGQYIQEGQRNIFETVISVSHPNNKIAIPFDEKNYDQLNFLAYKQINDVNKMAELGTLLAHVDGGVPNIIVEIPKINEQYIGQLIYFFEKACAISGYILGVNPFDQPGVEAYKKNMFALLGKPGFEKATEEIRERLM
jgi:glucose-6-phosphate isomerase